MPTLRAAVPATRVPTAVDLLAALALGALHTLAYVHTAAWPLALLAAGWLAWRVAVSSPRRAAWLGWLFGTAWLAAGTWWLFISMHRYGGLPAWMAAAAVALLAAFLSLYLALAMALFARWRGGRPGRDALLFAALCMLAELARGVIFTGFPWVAFGYAQVDSPLAWLAPFIGVYGIGAVAAGLAAWVALAGALAPRRALVPAIASAAVLAALAVLPASDFTRPTGTLRVTLLQGNVPQEEKFASEHIGAALEWHVGELLKAGGDLVVAPETAVPLLPLQMPEGFWDGLRERLKSRPTAALFGVPLGDSTAGYTNSAVGLAEGRPDYRYDKHHLVPFGEFIPTGFRWFTQMMDIPLGDFNRGPLGAAAFAVKGERVLPNICYEDLFGEELAASFTDAAAAPTILANLSNIGWFGHTVAVPQHLNITRLRTLELQRPMLRATNTGATAVVDYRGTVTASLESYTRGVLVAQVQGREGLTPFVRWAGRFGLAPLAILALAVVLGVRAAGRPASPHP